MTESTSGPAHPIVRWERLGEVGAALVATAVAPRESARRWLPPVLDRLTAPHRLLDQLSGDAEGVIAGDPLAAARLRRRVDALGHLVPAIAGSTERARRVADRRGAEGDDGADGDGGTVSFDGVVRLAAAVAVAYRDRAEDLDRALDVAVGLALQALAADRLARGLATDGQRGVARALHGLRLAGYPVVALPPMRTMSGGIGGLGGLPGGALPGGGGLGGLPQRPPLGLDVVPELDADAILDDVLDVLDDLYEGTTWDPDLLDQRPTWEDLLGFPPLEDLDRNEIRMVKCLVLLKEALTKREEPPPPRPDRVVWSDSITGLTVNGVCPGDRIVLHGTGFGAPSAGLGVALPTTEGCRAFPVTAADWTDTAITVTLPQIIATGPVGLVNLAYARAYDDWAARMNALTAQIIENARCVRTEVPELPIVPPFGECPPATPVNRLRAGLPAIRAFTVNGAAAAWVEPGQPVRLEWDLRNAESYRLTRVSNVGPQFAGANAVDNPPGSAYDLGPFTGDRPADATYELKATGPCPAATPTATVKVLLRKVPALEITGVEVTQAIQTFPAPTAPLVAHKDTIVRVYVAVDNLAGFGIAGVPNEAPISGELRLLGPKLPTTLPPLNPRINARPRAAIARSSTAHSLNFRIPAALATNAAYHTAGIKVWTADEIEAPPTGAKSRPAAAAGAPLTWVEKRPFKVRYVRVSDSIGPALSDAAARDAVLRAFDLLATPPTDIAPARLATWHTSQDINTKDGIQDLLDHIDDQHDCTFSEWLFPWEEECPDDDGAVWVAVTPRSGWGGLAQGYRAFNISRNTAVIPPQQDTAVHELGHTLSLNHVNPDVLCGPAPDGDFDDLPNGGLIAAGDAFDPRKGEAVPVLMPSGPASLFDFMTYACSRWVSLTTWRRVFDKF